MVNLMKKLRKTINVIRKVIVLKPETIIRYCYDYMLGLILYDFSFFSSIFGHYMALALPAYGSRLFFRVGLYTTIFFGQK